MVGTFPVNYWKEKEVTVPGKGLEFPASIHFLGETSQTANHSLIFTVHVVSKLSWACHSYTVHD